MNRTHGRNPAKGFSLSPADDLVRCHAAESSLEILRRRLVCCDVHVARRRLNWIARHEAGLEGISLDYKRFLAPI
jgi:hypothetical protein